MKRDEKGFPKDCGPDIPGAYKGYVLELVLAHLKGTYKKRRK